MQIATDRIRDGLRFIVIVKTSEIAPAGVAAQFNETRADHDPKTEPAKEPENENRRPAFRKRAAIKQGAEKDRQEPGLEKLDLPAVPVPDLADVNDGQVHCPKNRENDRIGVTGENNERQTEACPGKDRQ